MRYKQFAEDFLFLSSALTKSGQIVGFLQDCVALGKVCTDTCVSCLRVCSYQSTDLKVFHHLLYKHKTRKSDRLVFLR